MVVVVIIVEGWEVQDGLITESFVQIKIVIADPFERRNGAGKQDVLALSVRELNAASTAACVLASMPNSAFRTIWFIR